MGQSRCLQPAAFLAGNRDARSSNSHRSAPSREGHRSSHSRTHDRNLSPYVDLTQITRPHPQKTGMPGQCLRCDRRSSKASLLADRWQFSTSHHRSNLTMNTQRSTPYSKRLVTPQSAKVDRLPISTRLFETLALRMIGLDKCRDLCVKGILRRIDRANPFGKLSLL